MRHRAGLTCLCLWLAAGSASGAVRFVKADAAGANNGTSWADAYTDLQSALAASVPGDDVWVAAGTYKPATPATPNPRTVSFVLKSGVRVLGGFAGNEALASQRNPRLNPCVLSGDISGNDTPNFGGRGDNSFHVVRATNVTAPAALDGFIVRGGHATATSPDDTGAGLRVVGGTVSISNCIIRDNFASIGGGAILVNSNAQISQCVFTGNRADVSAALDVQGPGAAAVIHCTFARNTATLSTSAVRFLNTGGSMRGSILYFNSNPQGSGLAAQVALTNATGLFQTCDIQGGLPAGFGAGGFSLDPKFIADLGADGIAGTGDEDLRLKPTSPCIDRVAGGSLPTDPTDINGNGVTSEPVPVDLWWATRSSDDPATPNAPQNIVDLGPYELQGTSCSGDMNGDNFVNTNDLTALLILFGTSGQALIPGDFNADGGVNTSDLVLFLAAFGQPCL